MGLLGGIKVSCGETVKQVREKFRLDHKSFAKILNVSENKLRGIETGEIEVSFWQFLDIIERGGVMYKAIRVIVKRNFLRQEK